MSSAFVLAQYGAADTWYCSACVLAQYGAADTWCSSNCAHGPQQPAGVWPRNSCAGQHLCKPIAAQQVGALIAAALRMRVAGVKGRRIRELTSVVQKRFKFPEGTVELYAEKVNNRGLCAIAQAESLRYKLLGGLAVRRCAFLVVAPPCLPCMHACQSLSTVVHVPTLSATA